ncbi:MAG: phosphotransferase, partial [Candidatus Thorarchaeota archaeon]|nr:phosphotransferase [Candidatus Thorarchaeota archaeon]
YVRREVKLLDLLGSHLIYPVPKPEFVDTDTDHPYMGYKMIPGERLSIHSSNATPEQLRFVGDQMGRFIGGLHSLSENVLEGEAGPFTPEAYRKRHAETYSRIQKLVLPTLTTRQRDWAETLFHDFLDPDENFEFNPVIAHCDLYSVNILVNPVSFRVTGILDFENLDLNDPAADFIFLREGTELLTALIQAYPHEIDQKLGARATYLIGKFPFFYILKGMDYGLEAMKAYGYKRLDEYMMNWDNYMKIVKESFD